MITVNQIEDAIIVSCNEKDVTTLFSEEKMNKLLEIADDSEKASSMKEIDLLMQVVDIICNEKEEDFIKSEIANLWKNTKTREFHLKVGDVISHIPLPCVFVEYIQKTRDKGLSIDPMIKCWLRFLRNPKIENKDFRERFFNYISMTFLKLNLYKEKLEEGFSEEIAEQLATVNQVKITKEGLINCYKVSVEVDWKYEADESGNPKIVNRYSRSFDTDTGEITGDSRTDLPVEKRLFMPAVMGDRGDAFYCGDKKGHFIRVGETHRLESWDQVNCNDNQSCVKGLHAGGLCYIKGYSGEIHNVFIDPMNIGAIPDDQSGAMRVLEYFVHSSLVDVNSSIYHSSTYAAKTDNDWEKLKKEHIEAVDAGNEAQKEYLKQLNNI
jgi:hypothetical protein